MTTKQNRVSDFASFRDQYYFHSEIGSGGFGKVRLATHALTGDQVAVKIIDKKAVGDDLVRVFLEREVLKNLAHQNVCRMYQYFETEQKCYFVMEYCNGGEMFDYIVKKDRLNESEARYFFRQLIQAMAYVHSKGISHRDLKPENLMLTSDLELKLIDFGLAAQPNGGLTASLATCCGSPAYAAPEIIESNNYYGHEVDIWSMGVLLYVLLCGVLPFEDESLPRLYKKIKNGVYYEPEYLSPLSKDLLRAMLQVNPRHRISMKDLREHKWVTKSYTCPLKWNTVYDKKVIDSDISLELAFFHGMSTQRMYNMLSEWRYDYFTATYLVLLRRKERNQDYALPMYRPANKVEHVLHSPTIHKSLENDLDRAHVHGNCDTFNQEGVSDTSTGAVACVSPATRFIRSPHLRMNKPRVPQPDVTPILSARHKMRLTKEQPAPTAFVDNKENFASLRVRGPIKLDGHDNSIYGTPRRAPVPMMGSSQYQSNRAKSIERVNHNNSGTPEPSTPSMNDSSKSVNSHGEPPTPRRSKASLFPRRVFSSLERGGAKIRNLLTPRKFSQNKDEPMRLNLQDDTKLANLSITSSKECPKVREELIKVLLNLNIAVTANKWKISGRKSDAGKPDTVVELEIVWVETLSLVGVLRRRITGDGYIYKKICEQVLSLAGL